MVMTTSVTNAANNEYPPGEWVYVTSVPSYGEDTYTTFVPTTCDSTLQDGVCWSTHTRRPIRGRSNTDATSLLPWLTAIRILWLRRFANVDELREALQEFMQRYNTEWLIQRHGYVSPQEHCRRLKSGRVRYNLPATGRNWA